MKYILAWEREIAIITQRCTAGIADPPHEGKREAFMRNSKTWPMRAWRRATITILSTGVAAFLFAGLASPSRLIWN